MKHLEMIQEIINRMASNSFALKGWTVTLVAGIFALQGSDTDNLRHLVAFVPIIVFWGLDAFYLSMEKSYRSLYNHVCKLSEYNIDFSMDVSVCEDDKYKYWKCIVSSTELSFYLPLLILVALIILVTAFI